MPALHAAGRPPREGRRLRPEEAADVVLAAAAATAAAFAAALLPPGSALRVLLAWPLLLVVPGFLLLQALVVPVAVGRRRFSHALVAVGISPALVGLLALATALVPGGFRPLSIVSVVTGACLLLAAVALVRRARSRRGGTAAPTAPGFPDPLPGRP